MDELEFVQRCTKGDKQSWYEFVDKYSRLIYNYIYSVLNSKGQAFTQDNIRDIFQEIFLSLTKDSFKKLKSFRAKNNCTLASWLRQVTINFTIDYIRRLKPLISIDREDEDGFSLKDILKDEAVSVSGQLEQEERSASLKDCIGKLEGDDKYFLDLHIYRGLDLEALRAHFGLSRGAIDMRKSRIIDRLRECFKNKGFRLDF